MYCARASFCSGLIAGSSTAEGNFVRVPSKLLKTLLAGALALVMAAVLAPSMAQAAPRTIVVSPTGSDSAAGTASAPWKSVSKALLSARAGDTVLLRGGTYNQQVGGGGKGFLKVSPGRADARVTVKAYPGERPVISGLLWVTDMDYWTFNGVNVTWSSANTASDHMVRLRNGRGWVFENAEVWGAKSYANINVLSNKSGVPADWALRGLCVHDNYGDPAHGTAKDQLMYVNTGATAGKGTIERNVMFGAPRGKGVKLAGPTKGTGSANVTVRYNTIVDTYKPSIVVGWATKNTQVHNNIVANTKDKSLIRGYQLDGTGNKAWSNVGVGGPRVIGNDSGYASAVADGGGNVLSSNLAFDATGKCGAYTPTSQSHKAFGHTAP